MELVYFVKHSPNIAAFSAEKFFLKAGSLRNCYEIKVPLVVQGSLLKVLNWTVR
jgi:hypothetical protein